MIRIKEWDVVREYLGKSAGSIKSQKVFVCD